MAECECCGCNHAYLRSGLCVDCFDPIVSGLLYDQWKKKMEAKGRKFDVMIKS